MLFIVSFECGFIDRLMNISANWEQQLVRHAACGANRFMLVFSTLGRHSILINLVISVPYVYSSINVKVLGHVTLFLRNIKRNEFKGHFLTGIYGIKKSIQVLSIILSNKAIHWIK